MSAIVLCFYYMLPFLRVALNCEAFCVQVTLENKASAVSIVCKINSLGSILLLKF